MSPLAIFEILTDIDTIIINKQINSIWIGQKADAILIENSAIVSCALMYFYEYVLTDLEHIESVKNVVSYLLGISKNRLVYYYPDREVYSLSGSDDEEVVEIAVDDIFTEEYQPSLNSPFGYARFVIKKS
jgi:hypothetical protein